MSQDTKSTQAQLDAIKAHWQQAGRDFPLDAAITPTSRDPFLGKLEETYVLEFLSAGRRVLEVGCGDASHTLAYAARSLKVVGVDLSDTLLQVAEKRIVEAQCQNVEFVNGSVLELDTLLDDTPFDCAISQRCLINLPDWETQRAAIKQIAARLCPGGLLLFTEGFIDELHALNDARMAVGLEPIAVAQYNHNFERELFEQAIGEDFEIIATRHYGAYLFLSRVLHPLAVKPGAPTHDAPINRAAFEMAQAIDLPDTERYSYNRFYVLKKK